MFSTDINLHMETGYLQLSKNSGEDVSNEVSEAKSNAPFKCIIVKQNLQCSFPENKMMAVAVILFLAFKFLFCNWKYYTHDGILDLCSKQCRPSRMSYLDISDAGDLSTFLHCLLLKEEQFAEQIKALARCQCLAFIL